MTFLDKDNKTKLDVGGSLWVKFPFKRVFPTAVVYFYLNVSDSGKKSQVKIRGVLIFKIRLAGVEKQAGIIWFWDTSQLHQE